jgi:serine/threonine kinase PknH
MTLFISYSSRDHAALEKVRAALQRAHLQVWLDEELRGGEVWWNTILEEIRGCDVFIVALSKNYLESKPCQAELRYAQALHRSILPVQIGPMDSMRVNPLAAVQAIDYQSIDTGIELVAAVHARKAKVEPLPSPLPAPPPVPFEYLMRLDTAIAAPELSPHEQAQLLSDLKNGLETDGNEPSARRDLTQLLIRLRERPDVTWKIRTDVDNVLTSIQTKTKEEPSRSSASAVDSGPPRSFGSGPPPPSFSSVPPASSSVGSGAPPSFLLGPPTGPQPMPMPPFGSPNTGAAHPRTSSKRWIIAIAGGAVAAVAAAVAVIFLIIPSPPKPPPTITGGQLSSILLTADDINTIMGASHMQASDVAQDMNNVKDTASNPSCIGALYTAQTSVYAGSGWSGVRDQTLVQRGPDRNTDVGHFFVNQAAAVFPSADQAHAFLKTSANNWKGCAGQTVTNTSGNDQIRWSLGDVTGADPKIVQSATQEAGDGWACQHALSVASNVVVEVQTCSLHINDQASQIADKMVAKTTH